MIIHKHDIEKIKMEKNEKESREMIIDSIVNEDQEITRKNYILNNI